MKLYKRELLPFLILVISIISEFIGNKIPMLQYVDEVFAIIFAIYFFVKTLSKKKLNLSSEEKHIIFSTTIICLIGICSNLIFKIQNNKIPILLDILSKVKVIIYILGFKIMINKHTSVSILMMLKPFAKLFLMISFIFAISTQFFNTGMSDYSRYGIKSFYFIFGFQHIFANFVLVSFLIILCTTKNKKEKNFYIILSIVQMLLTLKGPSTIWSATILFILYHMKNKKSKKINIGFLRIIFLISLILGQYQIKTYFLDEAAPRAKFYKYALVTAEKYLPFGAGFATYGSSAAAKYYSPLYDEYGFNKLYGMTRDDTSFLNDNYWPQILGQFGFIGLLLGIYIVYCFFIKVFRSNINKEGKACVLSAMLFMIINSLGSSFFTDSSTLILCIIVVLVLEYMKGENNDAKKDQSCN